MTGKKIGLAEGASTARAPKRTRRKGLDMAGVFRLRGEQVEEILTIVAETGATEEQVAQLAPGVVDDALQALRAELIRAAKERNRLEAEKLDSLEKGVPVSEPIREDVNPQDLP